MMIANVTMPPGTHIAPFVPHKTVIDRGPERCIMPPREPVLRGSFVALLLLASAAASACARDHGETAVDGAITDLPPPPAPTLSRFDVPLEYDFTPILAIVERVVPRTFGSLEELHQVGDNERMHYAYEATRGPFTTFMSGSQVHMRATVSYAGRGYFDPPIGPRVGAGCGSESERPRIVIELTTPLSLGPDWHLRSSAQLAHLAPRSEEREDRCRVSVIRYDVTDRVIEAARDALVDQLPEIDRLIADVDLTKEATGWWRELNRPIRLADGAWLLLQPQQIRAGRVAGEGHILRVQAGLDAYPRLVIGPEPAAELTPLPPLGNEAQSTGFHVHLEGNVDYITASRIVTEELQGTTVSERGRSVTIRSVSASPQGAGRLGLAVTFSGDAAGTIRFVGTPMYDTVGGRILFPDLDYDLSTNRRVVNAAAWLGSPALRKLFRENAILPIDPVLARGRELLTEGLNRTIAGTVSLTATVDNVTVTGLYVTRPALVVHAGATGNARVAIGR